MSSINRVLNGGGTHNVLGLICEFAGQRELLHVTKAFRHANQQVMVQAGQMLSMTRLGDMRQIAEFVDERPAAEILPALFLEVSTLASDLRYSQPSSFTL
ncbi:MAG: hypothetical protein ACHQT8_00995 [Chlamydiales bacterium]